MELGLIQIPANLQDKEQFNRPLWTANIKGSDLKAGLRFVTNIDKMEGWRQRLAGTHTRTGRDGTAPALGAAKVHSRPEAGGHADSDSLV